MHHSYILNHWFLQKGSDGIVLIGHLHKRPGFSDGIEVMTTGLHDWSFRDRSLFFNTENSVYQCSLSEYVYDTHSLAYLLDCGYAISNESFEMVTNCLPEIIQERWKHCKELFSSFSVNNGALLCWNGCEIPYLKWIAYKSENEVTISDFVNAPIEAAVTLSRGNAPHIPLRVSSSVSGNGSSMVYISGSILLENDGDNDLFINKGMNIWNCIPARDTISVA